MCATVCVCACLCVCVDGRVFFVFFFLSVNVTAENTSVRVAAAPSCQAVEFSIISGHKFIGTVCVGG